jgi:hypothetical protein
VHWCPASTTGELQAAVCCPEPACVAAVAMLDGACAPYLADLSHASLHCTAVWPAVNWLLGVWARIAPEDTPVPLDARVLLLGDECVGACRW